MGYPHLSPAKKRSVIRFVVDKAEGKDERTDVEFAVRLGISESMVSTYRRKMAALFDKDLWRVERAEPEEPEEEEGPVEPLRQEEPAPPMEPPAQVEAPPAAPAPREPTTQERLEAAGFKSVAEVALAKPEALAEAAGLPIEQARALVARAIDKLSPAEREKLFPKKVITIPLVSSTGPIPAEVIRKFAPPSRPAEPEPARFEHPRDKPVAVGEVLELVVEDLGEKGDPVAYHQGLVIVLVDGERKVKLGDLVRVRIAQLRRNHARGVVIG